MSYFLHWVDHESKNKIVIVIGYLFSTYANKMHCNAFLQTANQLYCMVILKEWNYTYPNKQYKSYTVAFDNVCNF